MYTAGVVCHVLNRAVARAEIFSSAADYAVFEEQLAAACETVPAAGRPKRRPAESQS
jgi:hypothetical protein